MWLFPYLGEVSWFMGLEGVRKNFFSNISRISCPELNSMYTFCCVRKIEFIFNANCQYPRVYFFAIFGQKNF